MSLDIPGVEASTSSRQQGQAKAIYAYVRIRLISKMIVILLQENLFEFKNEARIFLTAIVWYSYCSDEGWPQGYVLDIVHKEPRLFR